MSDRTYGATRNCAGCRFWSEMVAQATGSGVTAMCLAEGKYTGKYTGPFMRCDAWKSGHFGAVDEPPSYGEETRAMYAEEEKAEARKARRRERAAAKAAALQSPAPAEGEAI